MDSILVTVKLCWKWKSKLRHLTTPTLFADIANPLLPVVHFGIVPRATGQGLGTLAIPTTTPESL